jgi:c-di-GMP-binding flagellar brake protein YcgR
MYPKINQNIVLEIKNNDRSCRSIVAEVGDKEILVSYPMDGNILGYLHKGAQLEVTYMVDENKFKFPTEITGRVNDSIPLFRLRKPQEKEIIKIQRRENFRVNANLRLNLKDLELNTINISAGGLLFGCTMDMPFLEGETLLGKLYLPTTQLKDAAPISFDGTIKRINVLKNQDRKNIAITFGKLEQRDQMKVIQYCFEKQRQNRLKERR